MLKLNVLFSIVLVLRSGRACDDIGEEEQLALFRHQQLDNSVLAYDYSPNPWSSLSYQPRSRLPGELMNNQIQKNNYHVFVPFFRVCQSVLKRTNFRQESGIDRTTKKLPNWQ